MAEAMLKELLRRDRKNRLYHVRSAGTWTRDGLTASPLALQTMKELGLDISTHRSHHLASEDIQEANLIIVMTQDHEEALGVEFPQAREKIYLLSEMADKRYDIEDPSGSGSLTLHRTCGQEIKELLEKGYSRILELAAGGSSET